MGYKLTGDQLRTAMKRLGDIQRQFGQAEYPHDPEKALAALQALDEGRFFPCSLFGELLTACKQTWVNDQFFERNFPLESIADDEDEWDVCEYHFNRPVSGLEAFGELEKLGYRLCGPRQAMKWIAVNLDVQLDHPLVVTACWHHSAVQCYVPVFDRTGVKRDLSLFNFGLIFNPCYGWLVLRKKTPVKKTGESFGELLSACKQAHADGVFNAKHFSLEPITDDEDQWEVCVHYFENGIRGLKAFEVLEQCGFRLCGPRRAMKYIADHLDDQLKNALVVTSECQFFSSRHVPIFNRNCNNRNLSVFPLNCDFTPDTGWLVLRKKTA